MEHRRLDSHHTVVVSVSILVDCTHTHTHTLCCISDHILFNPTADGGAPGGDGEGEEGDEDGPSDVEGGEEDGMSYSRMRKQQVG